MLRHARNKFVDAVNGVRPPKSIQAVQGVPSGSVLLVWCRRKPQPVCTVSTAYFPPRALTDSIHAVAFIRTGLNMLGLGSGTDWLPHA